MEPVLSKQFGLSLDRLLKTVGLLSLKAYKTASCAEIAGHYFNHWINVTCENGENWPSFKEICTKKIKLAKAVAKEKNPSMNPGCVA